MASRNPRTRPERLVVVGGNAAGMSAASKARRVNPALEVVALEMSPHVSYSACGIPYFVADLVRESSELVALTPEQFQRHRGITALVRHQVVAIKPVQRQVVAVDLESNQERCWHYDKCIVSLGASPNQLEIPGADLKNIFAIRTLQDGIRIRDFIDTRRPKRGAIVGGGYIAMEMAEACRLRGVEIVVLEKTPSILQGFSSEIVEQVRGELDSNEVSVSTSTTVTGFQANGASEVSTVKLDTPEREIQTDFVLICTGVTPTVDVAVAAGIRTGTTGGILVDWKQKTNVPNIYSAGDCVEVRNLVSGKPDYIPLGTTANRQGRVAGENIGGGTSVFRGVVGTSVFKVFGLEVAKTGLSKAQAEKHGFDAACNTVRAHDRASYWPGASEITITVVYDKRSRRLLGAQLAGKAGVSKRVDVFATALHNKMTLDDMTALDLSYAPPFSPVWDPVLVAVHAARGKLQ